ncbi:MAG TPA: DUF559 domain-containing protein [Chitinophagales bacterium]|nr:DUF559 domain-containing protein [Chitinophagales bacterium]
MPLHSNYEYNKKLRPLAQTLRKEGTPGERKLWKEVLSNGKALGYHFRRQRAIDNYIVDFFCKELNLIIEVDGINHDFKIAEDERRDVRLMELGYETLRVTHYMVMTDIVNVSRMIGGKIITIQEAKGLAPH